MKIFRHPLHLIFIHFPSALFPMECICYGLLYYTRKPSFSEVSYYCMLGGVSAGWLSVVFGIFDLAKIDAEKTVVMKKALIHAGINSLVLIVYTVLAFSLFQTYPKLPDAKISILFVKIIMIALMMFGNYTGMLLVFKHKVGIDK